jgi:hypothetical protein
VENIERARVEMEAAIEAAAEAPAAAVEISKYKLTPA